MSQARVVLVDIGGVLIGGDANAFVPQLLPDPDKRAEFLSIFRAANREADRTSWSETAPLFANKYPAYADIFTTYRDLYLDNLKNREIITGTVAVLKRLKSKYYKLYIASNMAADVIEGVKAYLPDLALFDGMQFSGQIGLIKPDPAFFQRIMKDFGFQADQALFFDDKIENIKAALALGINGILFETPEKLERELEARHLLPPSGVIKHKYDFVRPNR